MGSQVREEQTPAGIVSHAPAPAGGKADSCCFVSQLNQAMCPTSQHRSVRRRSQRIASFCVERFSVSPERAPTPFLSTCVAALQKHTAVSVRAARFCLCSVAPRHSPPILPSYGIPLCTLERALAVLSRPATSVTLRAPARSTPMGHYWVQHWGAPRASRRPSFACIQRGGLALARQKKPLDQIACLVSGCLRVLWPLQSAGEKRLVGHQVPAAADRCEDSR